MTTEYRDSKHLNDNELYQIAQLAKFIRTKKYGIDVRESIALAIEALTNIQAADNNDYNSEVAYARGEYASLGYRLNSIVKLIETNKNTSTGNYNQIISDVLNLYGTKISKGEVSVNDINKNLGKFDASYFTDSFLQSLAGGTINVTNVNDGAITSSKIANQAVTTQKASSELLASVADKRVQTLTLSGVKKVAEYPVITISRTSYKALSTIDASVIYRVYIDNDKDKRVAWVLGNRIIDLGQSDELVELDYINDNFRDLSDTEKDISLVDGTKTRAKYPSLVLSRSKYTNLVNKDANTVYKVYLDSDKLKRTALFLGTKYINSSSENEATGSEYVTENLKEITKSNYTLKLENGTTLSDEFSTLVLNNSDYANLLEKDDDVIYNVYDPNDESRTKSLFLGTQAIEELILNDKPATESFVKNQVESASYSIPNYEILLDGETESTSGYFEMVTISSEDYAYIEKDANTIYAVYELVDENPSAYYLGNKVINELKDTNLATVSYVEDYAQSNFDENIAGYSAKVDDISNRFNDQMIGNTSISEVIDARRPENGEAYETLGRRLNSYDASISKINNMSKEVISVSDFGAYGAEREEDLVDEGVQINAAIQYAIDNKIRRVYFPAKNYKTTLKMPDIDGATKLTISGVDSKTYIYYRPKTEGYFMTIKSTEMYVTLEKLAFLLTPTKEVPITNGIDAYRGNKSTWGESLRLEDVDFYRYTGNALKVYSPYNVSIDKCSFLAGRAGTYQKVANGILPPTDRKAVGILFTGAELPYSDEHGNVNKITLTRFYENQYAVKMQNVGATLFDTCTFEYNWIAIHNQRDISHMNVQSIAQDLSMAVNCWFENPQDRGGFAHPEVGIYTSGNVDEETGVITYPAGIDPTMFRVVNSHLNYVGLGKEFLLEQNNVMLHPNLKFDEMRKLDQAINFKRIEDAKGKPFVIFDSKRNYFGTPIESKLGIQSLDAFDDNNRYQKEYKRFLTGSGSSDLTIPLINVSKVTSTYTKIKAMVEIKANNAVIFLESSAIFAEGALYAEKTVSLTGTNSNLKQIDANNFGGKLVRNGSTIDIAMRANSTISANVAVTFSDVQF